MAHTDTELFGWLSGHRLMLHNALPYVHYIKIALMSHQMCCIGILKGAKMLLDSPSMTILSNYGTAGFRLHQSPYDV